MFRIGEQIKIEDVKFDNNYELPDSMLSKIKTFIEKYRSFIVFSYGGDRVREKVLYALKIISPKMVLYEPVGGDLKNMSFPPKILFWNKKRYILINFDEYEKYKNLPYFMVIGKRKGYRFIGTCGFGDDKELLYESVFKSYGISPNEVFDEEINLIDFYDYNFMLKRGIEGLIKWENRWDNLDNESKMLLSTIKIFVDENLTLENFGIPITWLKRICQKMELNFENCLRNLKFLGFIKIENKIVYPEILPLRIIPGYMKKVDIKSFLGIDDELNLKILKNLMNCGGCDLDPRKIININSLDLSSRIDFIILLLHFNINKYLSDLDISLIYNAEMYAEELKKFINNSDGSIRHWMLCSLGKFYAVKGLETEPLDNLTEALKFLKDSINIAYSEGLSLCAYSYLLHYVQVLINISYIKEPIRILKKAHDLITKYENVIPEELEKEFKYLKLNTKLHLYYHLGYEEGLKELLKDFEKLVNGTPKDSEITPKILTSLGILYMLLREYSTANAYFEESEKLQNKKHPLLRLHALRLYNLLNYTDTNLVIEDIKTCMEPEIMENAPITYGIYLLLLGYAHYKIFLNKRTNRLKSEAISILTSAVRFVNGLNFFKSLAWELMGDIYNTIGDYGLSQQFYMLSSEYFEKSPKNKMRLDKKIPL